MKISSRGRYGIQFLIDLAGHQGEGHITLSTIAARQHISIRYLEQVALILRRTGFIRSVKGAAGGYTLAKPPEDINIGDVLRTLEGDMFIIDPPVPGAAETRYAATVRRVVFDALNKKIAKIVDANTLAGLLNAGTGSDSYMYFI